MPIGCAPTRGVSTSLDTNGNGESRTDWTREEIAELFDLPFDELMWEAQGVHRRHHARGEVQLCTLRSEEHTSELQSLMRISYAVFCLKKKTHHQPPYTRDTYSLYPD